MKAPLEELIPRDYDPRGAGWYGASRGTRKHKGFDFVADPGTTVFSPINGFVSKIGQAYVNPARFKYIEISNDIYRIRLMYSKPAFELGLNDRVTAGQELGMVQDIAGHWGGGMLNHLHVEVYKHGLLTDPEPLFFPQELEKIV